MHVIVNDKTRFPETGSKSPRMCSDHYLHHHDADLDLCNLLRDNILNFGPNLSRTDAESEDALYRKCITRMTENLFPFC